jgi:benzoate 4-monooxygenase
MSTVRILFKKWDALSDQAAKSPSVNVKKYDNKQLDGFAVVESLDWCAFSALSLAFFPLTSFLSLRFNALAFDIIGDLAFGAPFDMLERDGSDIVAITQENGSIVHLPAVQILNERGEYSATLGCLPPWIRPYMKHIDPWFARGLASVNNLTGIARTRVNARLAQGAGDRKDILSHLQNGKDSEGNAMGVLELNAEGAFSSSLVFPPLPSLPLLPVSSFCLFPRHDADLSSPPALTQLIAGSDTTSNSSCAILHHIVSNPSAHKKLQQELDSTFGPRGISGVLDYDDVKAPELPYLSACISEALRLHSTSAMGLPRLMTRETEVCGEVFPAGTILSVPSYSIHRLKEYWGEDADEFKPERWLVSEERTRELENALNIFSYGPVRSPFTLIRFSTDTDLPLPFFLFIFHSPSISLPFPLPRLLPPSPSHLTLSLQRSCVRRNVAYVPSHSSFSFLSRRN